jgi:formamidopyrimidine-DNA glycosylase
MPELPEIETIRRSIEPHILNRKIIRVEVLEPRLRELIEADRFEKWAANQAVIEVKRRAKYLIWILENHAAVIIHLGMSGSIGTFSDSAPLEKHTHVIFHFAKNRHVRYRDPRRFGMIKVVEPGQLESYSGFSLLGPEPLSDDFTAEIAAERLKRSGKPIKHWLMDGQNVVGVGNIYANEVLFRAGIHPERRADSLSTKEQVRLVASVKAVLNSAVEQGGTTINDFRNADGEPGYFQFHLEVYQRTGEACLSCGSEIQRKVMGGRSTFFCPNCQH